MPVEQLPQFVRDLLGSPPEKGIHRWMFRTARVLHPFRTEEEIRILLGASLYDARRKIPARELNAAIRDSARYAWVPHQAQDQQVHEPSWPARDEAQIQSICADHFGLYDLWENSPARYDDESFHAEEIVSLLFPDPDTLLCLAHRHPWDRENRALKDWRGQFADYSFLVPNPMSARTGKTLDGIDSVRCLDNTGPRRFLVIEFDSGSADQHAGRLWHLGGFAPLILALHSGGKSLHGWFAVRDQTEDYLKIFMRHAVRLGADPVTWSRCQWVRMPDGTRDNGRRQTVFFFNPDLLAKTELKS